MDNKPTTASTFMGEEKTDQISNSVKDANATAQLSFISSTVKPQIRTNTTKTRIVENLCLIWLDSNIDESDDDCRNCITHLHRVVNSVNTFTDRDQCVDFLTEIKDETIFMIVSGHLGQHIIPLIHDISHLVSVYVFCENELIHMQWVKEWFKVKGVFTEIVPICEALKQASQQSNHDAISVSFVSVAEIPNKNLNQLDPSFMYTQILKEILFDIEYNEQFIKDLTAYCRVLYADNDHELKKIYQFEREYHLHSPIWWYTSESFLYLMLNRALRTLEIDTIIKMGFFIRDLHLHVQRLHLEQSHDNNGRSFTVYRGQSLSKTDFEKLMKTKGGLISFNNFLTTTLDQAVAFLFAKAAQSNPHLIGVLFKINIDPLVSSVPFARLDNVSYYKDIEEEILFSMHTIFRIGNIEKLDQRLWQVELILTSDNDPQLRALTETVREETEGSTAWERLGKLLIQLGQFNKAEELYATLLDHTSDNTEKAKLYRQFGRIKDEQGLYVEAISFYEKSVELYKKTIAQNHPDLASAFNNIGALYGKMGNYTKAFSYCEKALEIYKIFLPPNHPVMDHCYNNIGVMYNHLGEYSKALSFYEKALEISQKTLPAYHPHLATSYNNIGGTYDNMGEYSKALSFYEKALEISEKALPANHPHLATSYNNIGGIYDNMGEYSKALSFYEKALEISQKTLPANHPHLATSYNNIGGIYDNMGEYSKALSFYEKALEISQKTLPPNHPHLATSYNNIGGIYDKMGAYFKALSFYEKALEISQKALPPNHPHFATSYNNIGKIYDNMGEYSKALSFYEKALEIYHKSLPPNHPYLAISYNNIGGIYNNMGEYSKALSFYQKGLEIYQISLPSNHPYLAQSYNKIGGIYDNMGEYSKALSFYEKALEISQKTLPPNHPHFATSYNNIGGIYDNMGESSKALSFYEKALEISQKTLPPNHPHFATSYNNIGGTYDNMGEYSKALSFYEKALEISQKTLPQNHPDLATSYNNIGRIYDNMGAYFKALSFYENALEISQKTLPSNHPDLATFYNNIGGIYYNMGEYSKALVFYEKALEIYLKSLPSNHPNLAESYKNIGLVYDHMIDHSKALLFYGRALEVAQKALPPYHPDLVSSYDKIGGVYKNLADYSKALSFYEKALEVSEKAVLPDHPDLATSYNNIGLVCFTMQRYSHALLYYKKGLELLQKTLPSDHPDLATSFNNIGGVYYKMDEYSKALPFYEQALKINETILPLHHPDLATAYNNMGALYENMSQYSKAVSFYEKAIETDQKSLPPNHPSLATSFNNIGGVYYKMDEYSKALSFYEKALEIRQIILPPNHPHLTQSYKNISLLQSKMGEDSKRTDHEADSSLNQDSNAPDTVNTLGNDRTLLIFEETSRPSTEKANSQLAPPVCNELIGLSFEPTKNYALSSSEQSQVVITREQLSAVAQMYDPQTFLRSVSSNKCNILVVCFDIDSSSISLNSYGKVEFFQDECACIVRLLSTTDERVYFITLASTGQNVIPLIYEHRCIEQIYVYCSNDEEAKADWINRIPKIQIFYTNFNEINAAVSEDIESVLLPSSAWSRNKLRTRCHTQTLADSSKWSSIPLNIFNVLQNLISNDQIRIVVLHCGRYILFRATSNRFFLDEFSDTTECVQYLATTDVKSIFFIISGGVKYVIHDLQAITMLNQVYTVYVLLQSIEQKELNKTILKYENVKELFFDIEAVLSRLAEDIKFFVEQSLYMSVLSVFPAPKYAISKLEFEFTHEQNKFAAFQLFVNILRQLPSSSYCHKNLYNRCLAFAENKSNCESALNQVTSHTDQLLDWTMNAPFLSAIMNSLLQQQILSSLFDIQQVIVAVDQHLTELSSPLVVYRAQFIRAQDLERIKASTGELIAFHTFLLATKNLVTAREIARQVATSELLAVIFEIDVPAKTHIAQIDEDRFIFRFGIIFRVRFINLAPDGVWYVQLKCADSSFESIQEQLQFKVGERLTWLTLGNYLYALNNFNEAKSYYEYLLKMLPDNHEALPSIYNNMGLMFEELGEKEEALKYYDLAVSSIKKASPNIDQCAHHTRYKALSQSTEVELTVNRSDVYDKIAEIYRRQSEPQKALEFYQKALEETIDPVSRIQFEQKIQETLSLI